MLTTDKKIIILHLILGVFAGISFFIAVIYSWTRKRYPFFLKLSLIVSALGLLAIMDMYVVEPNWIKIEQVSINDPVLARVLNNSKVVQISDLHVTSVGFREEQLIKKINELKPDFLFITGDFLGQGRGIDSAYEHKEVVGLIGSLKATYGVFGVLGNYDGYWHRYPKQLEELQRAGIMILDNASYEVELSSGMKLWIAGASYSSTEYDAENRFAKALHGIPQDSALLFLNHYPDVFNKAHERGINLVLAGHTHGGQIGIPWLIEHSNKANKSAFMAGLYDSGKAKMYVNRGIGMSNLPVRFFCRPEITVFDFKGVAVQ